MQTLQHMDAFLAYLAAADGPEPAQVFSARAIRSDELPRFFSTLADGDVYVYDGGVAFLSLTDSPPGAGLFWKQVTSRVGDDLKQVHLAFKAATDPASIVKDAAKWLIKEYFKNEDRFAQAIANPNSLFVPMHEVTGVEIGRKWSQGNYIRISTQSGPVLICQDIPNHSDTIVDLARVGYSMWTRRWQPEFVESLQSAVADRRDASAA